MAALLFVGFLGRNPKVFEEVIPVEKVEIVVDGLDYNETWGSYVIIRPDEKGRRQYEVKYKVYPHNATVDAINFKLEAKPADCATIDEQTGLLTFSKPGLVKVFIVAADGSTSQDYITVICRQ